MRGGTSKIQEEMREVEEELEEDSSLHDSQNPSGSSIPLEALEEGKAELNGYGGQEIRASFSSRGRDHSPASPRRFSSSMRSSSPRPGRSGPSINFPLSQSISQGDVSKKGKGWIGGVKEGVRNTLQLMTNPVFAQAFILTFLGEWGDRSQITTIAMGGAHVSEGVTYLGAASLRAAGTFIC